MLAPADNITTLKPCLDELLRTCVHPPSLVLRVEHVSGKAQLGSPGNVGPEQRNVDVGDSDNDFGDEGNEARSIKHDTSAAGPSILRLVLSDGQLQIQAVLATHLHSQENLLHLKEGCLVDSHKFEVRSATRLTGQGQVVYLGIHDFQILAHNHLQAGEKPQVVVCEEGVALDTDQNTTMSPQKNPRDEQPASKHEYRSWSRKRERKLASKQIQQSVSTQQKNTHALGNDDSSDDGAFDTLTVSQYQVEQRRETLRQIRDAPVAERMPQARPAPLNEKSLVNAQLPAEVPTAETQGPDNDLANKEPEPNHCRSNMPTNINVRLSNLEETQQVVALKETTMADPAPPVPISPSIERLAAPTPLSGLLARPPQKPYHCPPLFALISWISPSLIHRPRFPPKRHLKIHDPSISDRHAGLTVAVFINAGTFKPEVGTIALFRGLVMNWVVKSGDEPNDVILNRYSLKAGSESAEDGGDDQEWYNCDEENLTLMGYDVQGMKRWWEERSANIRKERH